MDAQPTTWVLLKFSRCYADEFDAAAMVVTTMARWENAGQALRMAYPDDVDFDASFGTNESINFTAETYLGSFKVHEISLSTARELAAIFGRSSPHHAWDNKTNRCLSLTWTMLIEHGVLPVVPEESLDFIRMLSFPAPPARCAAHGNVIGECNDGAPPAGSSVPWAGPCHNQGVEILHTPDPDYERLVAHDGTL